MILSQTDTDRLINAESFENGSNRLVPEFLTKACLSSMLELMQKNLLTDTKGYYKTDKALTMDDKKEKNAGGITHFCLKHLVALMVTALFCLWSLWFIPLESGLMWNRKSSRLMLNSVS